MWGGIACWESDRADGFEDFGGAGAGGEVDGSFLDKESMYGGGGLIRREWGRRRGDSGVRGR